MPEKSSLQHDFMIEARFQQFSVRHKDCLEEQLKYFPRFPLAYTNNLLIMFPRKNFGSIKQTFQHKERLKVRK
jgi:hypothetical protein